MRQKSTTSDHRDVYVTSHIAEANETRRRQRIQRVLARLRLQDSRKERNADKRNSRGAVSFFREAESSLDQFAMDNSSLRCNNSPAEVAEWERNAGSNRLRKNMKVRLQNFTLILRPISSISSISSHSGKFSFTLRKNM